MIVDKLDRIYMQALRENHVWLMWLLEAEFSRMPKWYYGA